MEAYKEWSRENPYTSPGVPKAWRAALEWALSRECDDSVPSECIEKELEDK
ncbi:hypothetical protein LCGC14_2228830 [marine sediment metagenome]|uniref:Uncharacterized protein n=1 Tax=marine sediment metagenome TaxID=412755 RepID=A0A0F9D8Z0_9ZZZZ